MKNNIGQEFMLKTQYKYLDDESDQSKGMAHPRLELPYDNENLIDLPNEFNFDNINLKTLIENRRSVRKYSDENLSLIELAYLLWSTQGVKKILNRETSIGIQQITLRTVPSAGARHPFDTFILINKVEGLKQGLYRYVALEHKLAVVTLEENIVDEIVEASLGQDFIKNSAVTFIWVADVYRTKWRYGERAYRYVLLDAGHLCQNLYLTAESIDAGVCAIAAYDDEALNKVLNLDGENVFVAYMATLGKK